MSNCEDFSASYQPLPTLNSLILMGGRGTRLEAHRKTITQTNFPTLQNYWGQEGPKALTTLTLHGEKHPLLDWHMDIHCKSGSNINKFYLGLGFAGPMIEHYLETTYAMIYKNHPLVTLTEKKPAGTLAPLIKMYQNNVLSSQSLILANGDNFLDLNLYQAYLQGLIYAKQQQLNPNHCVVIIASSVDHAISYNYGVMDINYDTNLAVSFGEKRPVAENPFEIINGKKVSWINSGFSFILNPLWFAKNYITPNLVEISAKLEEGLLDYKMYEKTVKYETIYEKLASENHLIVVKQTGYWADSGNEELIKTIEQHYK